MNPGSKHNPHRYPSKEEMPGRGRHSRGSRVRLEKLTHHGAEHAIEMTPVHLRHMVVEDICRHAITCMCNSYHAICYVEVLLLASFMVADTRSHQDEEKAPGGQTQRIHSLGDREMAIAIPGGNMQWSLALVLCTCDACPATCVCAGTNHVQVQVMRQTRRRGKGSQAG